MSMFATIAEITTLMGDVSSLWALVVPVAVAVIGFRIGKRFLGKAAG